MAFVKGTVGLVAFCAVPRLLSAQAAVVERGRFPSGGVVAFGAAEPDKPVYSIPWLFTLMAA